ncbi:MAG: EF-hand domain-containing protein [Planctomycetota bacterium]
MHFTPLPRCLVAALACALFAPGSTPAQETRPKPDPEKVFKRRDTNGDGVVSEDEFLAVAKDDAHKPKLKKRFDKLDADGDGKLSLAEFKAGMATPRKK